MKASIDQIATVSDSTSVMWRIEHPHGAESLIIELNRATGVTSFELEYPSDDPDDADNGGWAYKSITQAEAKEWGFRIPRRLYA